MDITQAVEKALSQLSVWRDFRARLARIDSLEARVAELERKLTAPPCPRCRLPTWHLASSEPDKTFGKLGGMRRTYRCASCGLEEARIET